MIGLFQGRHFDRWRRLADIERLGERPPVEGERDRYFAKMRDGEMLEMFDYERDALLRRPVQLIPAEPGASIIRVSSKADDPWVYREPVIAWALCYDGGIRPVAPNGIPDDTKQVAYVEMPGGRIQAIGEWGDPCAFDTVDDMCQHFVNSKEEALDGL